MSILSAASAVFVINLPFGYWRVNVKKFSRPWFLSVHAPVPLVIAVRLLSGLGWQFITFPVMIAAFFGGQFAGGLIHRRQKQRPGRQVTSCLFVDGARTIRGLLRRRSATGPENGSR